MLLDVVVASVLGLILFSGLFDLTLETMRLNQTAADLAMGQVALIDLEGRLRLQGVDESQLPPLGQNLCKAPEEWLVEWCQTLNDQFGYEGGVAHAVLAEEGIELRAELALPGSIAGGSALAPSITGSPTEPQADPLVATRAWVP